MSSWCFLVFYILQILPLQISSFLLGFVYLSVNLTALQKVTVSSYITDTAVIQNDDLVCMFYGRYSLGNDDPGHIRKEFLHPLPDDPFRGSVHCAG